MQRVRILILGLVLVTSGVLSTTLAQQTPLATSPVVQHVYDVAGHIGLILRDCPGELKQPDTICFIDTRGNTERFIRNWDLYYDWESRVPHVATALTPWTLGELDSVERIFTVGTSVYFVLYMPLDASGLILIGLIE